MNHHKKYSLETANKDNSKRYTDPPGHAEGSLRRNVKRKRDKVQKSTLGGY